MASSYSVETPLGAKRSNRLALLAASGFVGGLIGYAISEAAAPEIYFDEYSTLEDVQQQLRTNTAVWFMFVILGIGSAIVIANYLIDKIAFAADRIVIALVSLAGGGFVSGYIAQVVYENMTEDAYTVSDVRPARIIGWIIAGAFGGAAVGAPFKLIKRVQNGVLGGAAGGLLGGALFDSFGSESSARLFGVCVIGTLMGLLIGGIDQARTNLWLEVISGEMKGRLFLLMDERTTIGSDRSLQVCLLSDRSIQPKHLELHFANGSAQYSALNSAPVLKNGVSAPSGRVNSGDVLKVGNTDIRVGFLKATSPSSQIVNVSGSGLSVPPTQGDRSPGSPRLTAYEASQGGMLQQSSPSTPSLSPEPPKAPVVRPRLQTKPRNE